MKFFDHFRRTQEPSPRERVLRLQRGLARCDNCKAEIPVAGREPLSLAPCPSCKALFFVPGQLEDWILCQPMRTGSFGRVYLALSVKDHSLKAAVKVMRSGEEVTDEQVNRFLREAEIGAKFGTHPNLMRVYAYGCIESCAFVVNELIEGKPIGDLIAMNPRGIDREESVYYALDVVSALSHIYSCGYLYRDLNLQNVIVRDAGTAALIDYGLCKHVGDALYGKSEEIYGTPLFVPPERCRKQGEDMRSEIYSFGMLFYYILTGRPFFPSHELAQIIKGHMGGARLPTASKMSGFEPDLAQIVDHAVRIDPEERYQSYDEISADLYQVLERLMQSQPSNKTVKARRAQLRQ